MYERLKEKAKWVRREVLKKVIETGKGHIGSTFSCTELLVALHYGELLRFKATNPKWEDRDRFVLGKGHVCYALYNILVDLGFFDASLLEEYGVSGGRLSVQCNIDTPGIEYNTGSLGNAIGIASGMALAAKMNNKKYKTYALIGDGECQEGSVWESLNFASQHKLNNLICIIDRNRLGVTDFVEDNLEEKILACGWHCVTIDGHSFESIFRTFNSWEQELHCPADRPFAIIADTIKGKGVSFMENEAKWHSSGLTDEEAKLAIKELS